METRLVEVDGARLAVAVSEGSGPPLVCLHAGVADSRMWAEMARWLPERQVVAPERRGHGQTIAQKAGSDVEDTLAVLDALGLQRPVLVGCSMGGKIALDLALQHPDRVSALVLIAPWVVGVPDLPFDPETERLDRAIEEAGREGDLERVNALEASLWLDGPSTPGRVGQPLRSLFLDMNRIALSGQLPAEGGAPPAQGPSAWERLDELALPTHLLDGALDVPLHRVLSERLVARIQGATHTRWPDVAHLPPLEQPERFARWLTERV